MKAVRLESEQNELIRRILAVDDVDVLKKVKALLLKYDMRKTDVVAEEAAPYKTKAETLKGFDEACKDMKLAREGKLKGRPIEELLDEL